MPSKLTLLLIEIKLYFAVIKRSKILYGKGLTGMRSMIGISCAATAA